MSIDRCENCGDLVDTDINPDAYVLMPNYSNTAMPVNPAVQEKDEWECVCDACQRLKSLGEYSDD